MDTEGPEWPGDLPGNGEEFGDGYGDADLTAGPDDSFSGYDDPTEDLEAEEPDSPGAAAGDDTGGYPEDLPDAGEPPAAALDNPTDDPADDPADDPLDESPPAEPVLGTDPDADPLADDPAWSADPFPPALNLDQPEPVDGYPWSDAALLGESGYEGSADGDGADAAGDLAHADYGTPPVTDLAAYDGQDPAAAGAQTWTDLAASDDPAVSTLARFWAA